MKPNVAAVYGLWSFIPGDSHPKIGLLAYEFLRDLHLRLLSYKRPDYIIYSKEFRGISYKSPSLVWSDHNPVLMDIVYLPPPISEIQ